MYLCEDCNHKFEEPRRVETTFESYYGVSDLFSSSTRTTLFTCPSCGSEEISELEECDCCGEFVKETYSTEGMINGGIGYVCENCLRDMEDENGRN